MATKTTRPKPPRAKHIVSHEEPGIRPEDLMSDAGRKMLAFHLRKFGMHEPGVRAGDDRDAIHDMRVTSRRMRSILQLFGPYYRKRTIKPYAKMLRQLARSLGDVRDLDVLQAKAEKYLADHPDVGADSLNGLLSNWHKQAATAHQMLIGLLDSRKYERFVIDFAQFVGASGDGARPKFDEGEPMLVRQVAPQVVYEHLAAVRAYETLLDNASLNTLHLLRIKVKRLHYALEAFVEVMGPEAKTVLEAVKTLQDYLGNLQDARVAGTMIQDYLDSAGHDVPNDAVLGYLSARADEKQHLLTGVSEAWGAFSNPEIRRALAVSISVL